MDERLDLNQNKYVVFSLGKEKYGIDIQKVTIIEKMLPIARVPKSANYIKGVINLRGEIILTVDLRIRFGFPEAKYSDDTRIIIIKNGDMCYGIIVDIVDEVIELPSASIESVTSVSTDLSMDYILGVGKIDEKIIILLNLEKLIVHQDL